jgi:hypothetical protein
MKSRYIYNPAKVTGDRVKSKDILIPKIRAEFYVRLFSLLKFEPEITYEGYEFYIKDTVTGMEFSAGLTGFGPGYFCKENSLELETIINEFDGQIFDSNLSLVNCQIEFEHDYGKSIFGCTGGEILESDIEEE